MIIPMLQIPSLFILNPMCPINYGFGLAAHKSSKGDNMKCIALKGTA
jgi:hypothetical protein